MKKFLAKSFSVQLLLFFMIGSLLTSFLLSAPAKKVNINTASVAELQTLPRIGPQIAQRIVDFRSKNGKFKRIEEIMKVRGIGEKVFEVIKDKITVGSGK
ncbi:MAG: helix-hairpin-helix domain-containing protein [Candidatus Aminicenantes bacterium]|nr:helix-hairpin-helix domain-containing protein [Candidatus Aminicenantes bacterium]